MCPQSRESAFQNRELLAKQRRTKTFDPLHKFMDTELWINFTKHVDVIGHYFKFDDFTFQIISDLLNDFLQSNLYAVHKYLAAILRTKNNMLLTGVEYMTIAFISLCAHNSYYTTNRCIIKAKPFLTSPMLKQGALRNIW